MAAILGLPLMPWQRLVADVLGEIDPDTGLPAYRDVIVTVPRQSGKTTLILCVMIVRAIGWDAVQRIAYSAQTGNDARKKLIEDFIPVLKSHQRKLNIRRFLQGMGNEAIEFANGSRIILLSSAADAGHGKTLDLGIKDELFADTDNRRDQALVPAMATRPAAQVLTMSTMGTLESIPLNAAVERGRGAVESGLLSGTAYFEWSADPDADPSDPATWWSCMPALGHTISEAVVRQAFESLSEGEFRRAFLNQLTKSDERVIPLDAWRAVVSDQVAPDGALVFALDVNPERSTGAIVAAAGGTVELVANDLPPRHLVRRAVELDSSHAPLTWMVDATGPAAALIPDLEGAGLSVTALSQKQMVAACGQFFDGIVDGKIRIRQHAKFEAAAAGVAKRTVGDAWVWARKNAAVDITPLVAATLALSEGDGSSVYDGRGLVIL